ncbi:putative ribonuclease H-like domain-containing protein, partial [Tanacetum coccineum]
ENDKYKIGKGYHVVPPPYTGDFMPSKPDLVLADGEYVFNESITSVSSAATSEAKTSESKLKSVSEPLIEDWISNNEDEIETESKSKQRKPSFAKIKFVKSNEHVKSPRESVKKVESNKQAKYLRKNSQTPRDCDINKKKMVEKPIWNNARRLNHQNSQRMTHPHLKGNFVPKAVLMKSSLKTFNTARQNSSRAAVSVNAAKPINTAYPRLTVNCARPTSNVFNRAHSHGNPQQDLKDKGVIDSGCSRHMTGNRCYLTDYEEIDGGFVTFGGSTKGGKIIRKVPRKDNMYITDLKNVVPQGGLTCLFAKATLDESNLWHRRLGHVNFKTINKLVKGNLVRGLPSILFEINQTCVACQKGKQHRASSSTPMETSKPLMKDENAKDVDVHLYRSMIGSLIIFRYLKGQPKLGLWYPKDSPFDLKAYTNSDYAGTSLEKKSTTGGCQFLGSRLISWQCKKQTVVANSTTEAEYVAASSCCGHVLWIQNQLLDYGYNFMNTKIFIDNESTICIVKNPVFYSKTKHIEIRHHFIRDSYEKRLIQVIKIHTDHIVTDLLTKAFNHMRLSLRSGKTEWKRAAITASSLEVEQDSGNINRTYSMATLNESFPQGTNSGSGPRLVNTVRLNLMLPVQINAAEEKPKESNGFEGINDFLNESSIKYALTVNPTIYTSCIKQFWATAKVKTVNGELQIQALVDGKKVIVTETSKRRALHLKDAEGTDCLPTATIFAELERMGYENLTQKLTFYEAYFSPQWKFLIHTILQCLSAKTTA